MKLCNVYAHKNLTCVQGYSKNVSTFIIMCTVGIYHIDDLCREGEEWELAEVPRDLQLYVYYFQSGW